ncbi:LAMI_0E10000g1_1 [Lachancea mirantina]|uniref:NEDD8-activating enzyme E1 catalytic subunit n=1 Tax=Lachancea mirantina TaxID=1230905 RepID=A0A1G4JNX0_9SACH|nr:LAMI_0E10000g1_1 [Lachancea mirantina]
MTDLTSVSVLVLGAGGLGCEMLKNLALQGIPTVHVVDMDTIELTNLNRQFLFTEKDVGRAKVEVAAEYINSREIVGAGGQLVKVTPHFQDLTLFTRDFLAQFTFVISGLDSVEARRHVNAELVKITLESQFQKCIPFIDGASEGFKGHCKVIIPGFSACYECSLNTLPAKTETYPLCTVANNPRKPEHLIEYALMVQWPQTFPDVSFDYENPDHLHWLTEQSIDRAQSYAIDASALTPNFILGVIKNIVPSVVSTNAIIAGQCCIAMTRLLYDLYDFENSPNFSIFNGEEGAFSHSYLHSRDPNCLICGDNKQTL